MCLLGLCLTYLDIRADGDWDRLCGLGRESSVIFHRRLLTFRENRIAQDKGDTENRITQFHGLVWRAAACVSAALRTASGSSICAGTGRLYSYSLRRITIQ